MFEAPAAVELAENVADVHVDRALAEEELDGDPAVDASDGHELQHFELAARQSRIASAARTALGSAASCMPAAGLRYSPGPSSEQRNS